MNGLADLLLAGLRQASFAEALTSLAGISAFVWFALFTIAKLALEDEARRPAGRLDQVVAGAALLAALVPIEWAGSLAVLGLGLYLFATATRGSAERRIAIVLLALTGTLIWGRVLLRLFGPALLGADAALIAIFSGTEANGNLVAFSGGGNFVVAPGCSSLHGMSLAVLFWASVGQLLRQPVNWRTLLVCFAGIAAMLTVNLVRLVAIALYPRHFESLHSGSGGDVMAWTAIVLSSVIILYGFALAQDPAGGRGPAGRAAGVDARA